MNKSQRNLNGNVSNSTHVSNILPFFFRECHITQSYVITSEDGAKGDDVMDYLDPETEESMQNIEAIVEDAKNVEEVRLDIRLFRRGDSK